LRGKPNEEAIGRRGGRPVPAPWIPDRRVDRLARRRFPEERPQIIHRRLLPDEPHRVVVAPGGRLAAKKDQSRGLYRGLRHRDRPASNRVRRLCQNQHRQRNAYPLHEARTGKFLQ
jgi:hypothetical protein